MIRKLNHWLEPIKLSVRKTRAGLRTICTEVFRWPQLFLTVTPRRRAIGRLTKSGEGKLHATPAGVGTIQLHFHKWLLRNRITILSDPGRTNKSRGASLFG